MDSEFTDEPCCVNCQKALNSLHMWYYMDENGIQQGPFHSFSILYFIHSGYFNESSVFFLYHKLNGTLSSYNTLLHFLDTIVEDVKRYSSSLFTCSHFMAKYFSTNHSASSSPYVENSPSFLPHGYDVCPNTDTLNPSVSPTPINVVKPKSPVELEKSNLYKLETKTILKKRVEENLKEAEVYLQRVNSRKAAQRFENPLLLDERTLKD